MDVIKKMHPSESSHLIAFDLINECLRHGNVLFDANNCKYEHRVNLINSLTVNCIKYAIVFDVSPEKSMNYLELSPKENITYSVISRQYKEYLDGINRLENFVILSKSEFENKFCHVKSI